MPYLTQLRPLLLPLLLAAACLTLLPGARAQEDSPAVAMGNGRMVRGTVSAVQGDHLTVKTDAGETYTVALTPNTQVRHGRDPLKAADIHTGDGIGAMGELDRPNRTVHALFVQIVSADEVKKAKDSLGKTWIAGNVTAIDEVKITVHRPDGVNQTIQVDEDTSFKRGGRNVQALVNGSGDVSGAGGFGGGRQGAGSAPPMESITLADVKIGDSVAGQGALKSGIFIPTQLIVGDPQRRRRQADASGAQPPAAAQAGPK